MRRIGFHREAPESRPILELESQLKANQVEIANRRSRKSRICGRSSAEYQGRLNMAPVMEQQFADITRDYDQSKADYESLLKKKNESSMATDLEKTQQGEHFRMMDPPNLPSKPSKPNRLLFCAAGLVVGLVLGGGVAAAREKLSGKVYSEREIKKLVPFAVIAEIPPIETPEEQRIQPARGMAGRGGSAGGRRLRACSARLSRICTGRFNQGEIMYKTFYRLQKNPFEITPDPVVSVSDHAA